MSKRKLVIGAVLLAVAIGWVAPRSVGPSLVEPLRESRAALRLTLERAPVVAAAPARVMPSPRERVVSFIDEHGVPAEARDVLAALGTAVTTLREHEAVVGGDRDTLAAERRAVSEQARQVLERLPAKYRGAMRRNRVSERQLATWLVASERVARTDGR